VRAVRRDPLTRDLSEDKKIFRVSYFNPLSEPASIFYKSCNATIQGRQHKNFQGGGQRKTRPKNSTIMPLPGGSNRKNIEKIAKEISKNSTI